MFKQGAFQIDPNLGPDALKKKRDRLNRLVRYGEAESVPRGVVDLVGGFLSNRKSKKIDAAEAEGRKSADDLIASLTGGRTPGPMGIGGIPPVDTAPLNPDEQFAGDVMGVLKEGRPEMEMPLPSRDQVASYITKRATEYGIDPKVALAVARSEGLNADPNEAWQSNVVKNGKRENSFGPFQLYTDGGLGNSFMEETGLDPRDASTWQQQVDYALGHARQNGWGAWYGAANTGIGDMQGIPGGSQSGSQGAQPAPQSDMSQLQAALSNPWLTQPQRAVVLSMIQQQQQANDPMRQLDMQLKQAQVDAMSQPKPGYRQASGKELGLSGELAEAQFNVSPDGQVTQIGGSGQTINVDAVGGGGALPGLGKLPAGQTYLYDEAGRVKLDENGVPRVVKLTPEGEKDESATKDLNRATQRQRAGGTVVQDLQRGMDLLDELSTVGKLSGPVGATGRVLSALVPGTVSNRVQQFTESALSNVGLDVLQQMRENSPTGGALGQVPIQQQKRLEQVLGSLRLDQELGDLQANMQRVMNIYTDIMYGSAEERAAAVKAGKLSQEENASIDQMYFDLPFDDRGNAVESEMSFEVFKKDPTAIKAAEEYGVTLQEMWDIKQGLK